MKEEPRQHKCARLILELTAQGLKGPLSSKKSTWLGRLKEKIRQDPWGSEAREVCANALQQIA